jgi:predicted RND superfamily exporter protein
MKWITSFHQRHWAWVITVTLLLSVLSVPSTIKLFKNISTDPIDLLPKDNPNVLTLLKVRQKLERGTRLGIVIESQNREANIAYIEKLATDLEKLPRVGHVEWRKTGYDFFDQSKLLYMEKKDLETIRDRIDKKIQKEKLGGFYIDLEEDEGEQFSFKDLEKKYTTKYTGDKSTSPYNESPDGKIFSLTVESKPEDIGMGPASELHDALDEYVKNLKFTEPTMKVYLTGATKVIEYRTLIKDLTRVGIISLILIFIPLLIRFRNPFHVLLMFLPLLVAMPISFALTSIFVPRFNVCTSFLFSILGGLGIENGIHIFSRYYEERKHGLTQVVSLESIYTKTGRAILTAVASVAVTFLALMFNDFRGFSEFGIISGIGLWVIFIIYFIFMPSLLVGAERIKWLRLEEEDPTRITQSKVLKFKFNWILVGGIILTAFSIAAIPFLSFQYDAQATRARVPEFIEAKAKQRKTVTRVNNPAVMFIQGKEEADRLKDKVQTIIDNDRLTPTVDAARSYYDLMPPEQESKIKVIHQIKRLLDDKTIRLIKGDTKKDIDRFRDAINQTVLVTDKTIPDDLKYVFKGNDKVPGELFYINAIPNMELDDGVNAMRFADDVSKITVGPHTYYPSSDAIVYGLVLKTMLKDTPKVMIISALLIIFFVFLDFRRILTTLVVVTPIFLGVLWMLGMMWIANIQFNFFNIIIIPAVLGMSIDNSIHIFHRYKELGPGSLSRVLSSTGLAALLASLTNASSFCRTFVLQPSRIVFNR